MLLDNILQAVQLFILGMGTVFSLLCFLILSICFLSYLCKGKGSEDVNVASDKTDDQSNSQPSTAGSSQEIAAATVAVNKYRQKR